MTTEEQFIIFWNSFPRKVAKANARKAFMKHIKLTTLEIMLDAITKYVAHKPTYADYCHPASWLNGARYEDEYEQPQARVSESNVQHRQREILMMQYRNARDEGNATEAARLRALIG